jgi:uncharacterized membrane protein YphA (DoxX/SURF4 family)
VPALARVVPQAPIPSDPKTLVRVNGAVQIVSGLMLATGKAPRLAAAALATSLVPTTLAAHRFWDEGDPATASQQRTLFFKNLSAGGGLLLAAVDTEGKPGCYGVPGTRRGTPRTRRRRAVRCVARPSGS